jgi:hypothetical protein
MYNGFISRIRDGKFVAYRWDFDQPSRKTIEPIFVADGA